MGPPSDIDHRIRLLAEAQHGVVARWQLLTLGLGSQAIKVRRRAGRLIGLHPGEYALGRGRLSPEGRWMAAVLACGDGAVLSHRSAARLLGLRPYDGVIEVTVPTGRNAPRVAGVRTRRSEYLDGWTTRVSGIPVTSGSRTLLDLAALVPAQALRRAVQRAEQLEIFDLGAVRAALAAHPRRPGSPALRALLDDVHAHDLTMTRSDVEAAVLQLCLDAALPRPQVNRWDGTKEVDFRWPAHGLVIEIDGWQTHRTRAAFERDRERSQILTLEGVRLVRFSARQVQRTPALVAARLRAMLDGAAVG